MVATTVEVGVVVVDASTSSTSASTPPPSSCPSSLLCGRAAAVVIVVPPTPAAVGHRMVAEATERDENDRQRAIEKMRSIFSPENSHFSFSSFCSKKKTTAASKKNEEAAAAREARRRRLRRFSRRVADDAFAAADRALVPGVPLRGWEVRKEEDKEGIDEKK